MKPTAIVVVIGLLAGVGIAVAAVHRSPAEQACEGLRDVCGAEIDVTECERDLDGAKEREIEDVIACVEPADNCIEAVACLGGAALRDAGEGFFRGVMQTR